MTKVIWQTAESKADTLPPRVPIRGILDYGLKKEEIQGNSTFGDSEPIPMKTILQIRSAVWRATEVLKMELGDLVLLDNNLFQHGRMHCSGTRKHFVLRCNPV